MKKLLYFLPLLILFAGCLKPDVKPYEPLVPYGTFTGKFTRTNTDAGTSAKTVTTANVELAMSTTGYAITTNDNSVHAQGSGEFLGNESTIDFQDPNYPTTGTVTAAYLQGSYAYAFNGSDFRLTKAVGDDVYEYVLAKKL